MHTTQGSPYGASGSVLSHDADVDPFHMESNPALRSRDSSDDDGASESSPRVTTPRATFGNIDSLSLYLDRTWGEPTPDCSPSNGSLFRCHMRHISDALSSTDECPHDMLQQAASSTMTSCLPTLMENGQPSSEYLDHTSVLSYPWRRPPRNPSRKLLASITQTTIETVNTFQVGESRSLPYKRSQCFDSNATTVPEEDDVEERSLEFSRAEPKSDWRRQVSKSSASSDGDAQTSLRQVDLAHKFRCLPLQISLATDMARVLESGCGAASTVITTAEISQIIAPICDQMVSAIDDVLERCTEAEDSSSLNTSGNSRKSANVCHHWKCKGMCRYGDDCKFMHPNSKRGVGRAMRSSKPTIK